MALTMSEGMEQQIRDVIARSLATSEISGQRMSMLLAELDATRAALAEAQRERDAETMAAERDYAMRCEVEKALAAREADVAALLPFARFGSWAFEHFWHDGEPGDIEGDDAQEKAVECGLLGRTSETDPAATHAEGCDYSPDAPAAECCCYVPTRKPLDVARLLPRSDTPTTPAQMGEQGEDK